MTGLCYLFNSSYAQVPNTFMEVSGDLGVSFYYESALYGEGVSFYDFDNDGWDDLTMCNNQGGTILFKNFEGFFEPWQNFPVPNAKNCLWGDLNNDGDNEIIFSTLNNGLMLFDANENGYFVPIPQAFQWLDQVDNFNNLWLYGMSLSDINLDGYLDIIVANYNTERANFAFLNQQNLNFLIDPNTAVKSFHKATFQTAAVDINHDLTPDLYFANDFEHGNDFFYNNIDSTGQGLWELASESTGLNIAISSMCNSWCDFDNDQDLDVYVSNLEPGNKLMQNNGSNYFQNISDSIGLAVHRQSWSSLWIDANNDQWNDLLVTSANADNPYTSWNGHFFTATGQGDFTQADTNTFLYSAYNSCKGDFNRDGLYDIAMSAANQDVFKLYQNQDSSTNHFIRFTPEGKISNRNGIGCHYYLYTSDNVQYGYIQSGENYLGQNSQHIILGMGANLTADSLIIKWPSGIIDKYFNIPHQSEMLLVEGKSKWYLPNINLGVCQITDTILYTLSNHFSYLWMDGQSNISRWLSNGSYSIIALYNNHPIDTNTFDVQLWSVNKNFTITPAQCQIGSYGSIDGLDEIQQYSIAPAFDFDFLPVNEYELTITNDQGCTFDTLFSVSFENEWLIQIADTTWICEGNSPIFDSIVHSSIPIENTQGWEEGLQSLEDSWSIQITNILGCTIDTTITIIHVEIPSYALDTLSDGQEVILNISDVQSGQVFFEINQESSITITTTGEYNIVIENNGCYWMDSVIIEILVPNEIEENTALHHWRLDKDELIYDGTQSFELHAIYNAIGQQIPFQQTATAKWKILESAFPIYLRIGEKYVEPYYVYPH